MQDPGPKQNVDPLYENDRGGAGHVARKIAHAVHVAQSHVLIRNGNERHHGNG